MYYESNLEDVLSLTSYIVELKLRENIKKHKRDLQKTAATLSANDPVNSSIAILAIEGTSVLLDHGLCKLEKSSKKTKCITK